MFAGDPSTQWEWHEAFRDNQKNMYRTTYTDMVHFKETNVKSNFPAGYGGHVPRVRFDSLHGNTALERTQELRRQDPSRDAHPSFEMQLSGLPTYTAYPSGARKNPTKGVVPHSGWTTQPRAPWGLTHGRLQTLNQRCVPHTIRRNASAPSLVGAGAVAVAAPYGAAASPPTSPATNELKRAVKNANTEAHKGYMPTEAEMLAEQQL